jgi:hypothetical protein
MSLNYSYYFCPTTQTSPTRPPPPSCQTQHEFWWELTIFNHSNYVFSLWGTHAIKDQLWTHMLLLKRISEALSTKNILNGKTMMRKWDIIFAALPLLNIPRTTLLEGTIILLDEGIHKGHYWLIPGPTDQRVWSCKKHITFHGQGS